MSDEPPVVFDGPHLFREDGSLNVWVPFEERPRPDDDLVGAKLKWDGPTGDITITHADPAASGRIFAWLMGQVQLARREPDAG